MSMTSQLVVGVCPGRPRALCPSPVASPAFVLASSFASPSSTAALEIGSASCSSSSLACLPQNGCQWQAMRHGKRVPHLDRPADQRKALLRALTTQVLRHGSITTTKTKAKAARKWVDKMIGLAKAGTLHDRRQALAFIYDESLVQSLFKDVPARYGDRAGGYCSVVTETYRRKGDNAPMAKISLV